MSARPLIGLTMGGPTERRRLDQPVGYHEAVHRAGGRALHLPPGDPDIAGLLDLLDAVVFTGGGDVDPARMQVDQPHPAIEYVVPARDDFEFELMRSALEREMPMFAICRGMQVLNVALGGTLHAHLPDVVGTDLAHRADPPGPVPHTVAVGADSLLARSMGADNVEIASWHHQAVDQLGAGLRVVATAPDGTIEAVELDSHRFLLAVQWHPELTAASDPIQQRLFDALVTAAAEQLVTR